VRFFFILFYNMGDSDWKFLKVDDFN